MANETASGIIANAVEETGGWRYSVGLDGKYNLVLRPCLAP